jgi:hypothetical protein
LPRPPPRIQPLLYFSYRWIDLYLSLQAPRRAGSMDRALLDASRMNTLRFSLVASFALITAACSGEPDGELSTSSDEEVVCPLSAGERAEVERVIDAAHTDASWIATQSPGYKAPVQRAFGAQVPLAEVPSLFVMEVMQDCYGEAKLPKKCADNSEAKSSVRVCTEFMCEEDGTLLAEVSLDAVPSVVPASSGPGEVGVLAFEHATRFKRSGDTDLAIKWSTRVDIEPEQGRELDIKTVGKASMSGGILLAYHVDMAVDGYEAGKFTAISDYDGATLAGMGSVGDTPVVLFDTFGYSWIGPCTPGIGD